MSTTKVRRRGFDHAVGALVAATEHDGCDGEPKSRACGKFSLYPGIDRVVIPRDTLVLMY